MRVGIPPNLTLSVLFHLTNKLLYLRACPIRVERSPTRITVLFQTILHREVNTMKTVRILPSLGTILFLFAVTAGSVFAEGGRPGGRGVGGSHYRLGGLGLSNPSASYGFVGGGYGGGGYGIGWGAWIPGYPNNPYGYETGRVPTPPYFAIHPPVYYGKRVGMPYGNSTVTRPPRAVVDYHPAVQQVAYVRQPAMILNPFAGAVSEAESSSSSKETEAARNPKVKADKAAVDKQRRQRPERAKRAKESSRSKRKNRKSAK